MAKMDSDRQEEELLSSLELERAAKDAAELATRMEGVDQPTVASMLSSLSSRLFRSSVDTTAAEVDAAMKKVADEKV